MPAFVEEFCGWRRMTDLSGVGGPLKGSLSVGYDGAILLAKCGLGVRRRGRGRPGSRSCYDVPTFKTEDIPPCPDETTLNAFC